MKVLIIYETSDGFVIQKTSKEDFPMSGVSLKRMIGCTTLTHVNRTVREWFKKPESDN